MKKATFFLLIVLLCLSAFLYKESFSSYFFQDDWFTLFISRASNFSEFLKFFVPRTDVIYYRPLGMQVFFFTLQSLFGITPLAFRLVTLMTHVLTSIVLFGLTKTLTRDILRSWIVSILYAASSVFFIPYFWAATYPFMLAPFLFFLSFFLYHKSKMRAALGVFFLGLLTNEIIFILPVVLFFFEVFMQKRKKFGSLFPFLGLAAFFSAARFIFFRPPTVGSYSMVISKEILHNLIGYGMWVVNWPEEMKAQMISFGRFNPVFVSEFKLYFDVFIISFITLFLVSFCIPLVYLAAKRKKTQISSLIFYLSIFFLGIATVIFFPAHSFSYYLVVSVYGALLIFTEFISKLSKNKFFQRVLYGCLVLAWLTSSYFSIQFNEKIHWAAKRGERAKTLILNTLASHGDQNGIYYVPPGDENKLSLNDQDALRVILKDDSVTTVYGYPPVEPLK